MGLEIIPFRSEHVEEAARICFDAFGSLHDRHHTPRDFDDPELAHIVIKMLSERPDTRGFAAMLDGRLVGSNFIMVPDAIAGIGPITVDPGVQSHGVGRALMQAVIDSAREQNVAQVRLVQEAINTTSLSLYTKLGFDWRDSLAVLKLVPASTNDDSVLDLTHRDLEACDTVCRATYRNRRRNELAGILHAGLPAFVRRRGDSISGYLVPGFFGHGAAQTHDDMLALMGQAARRAPEMFHKVLLPLSQSELYRRALERGHRTIKVMSYMTMGRFDQPHECWLPSIAM